MPEGPGVLSGEKGEFILAPDSQKTTSSEQNGRAGSPAPAGSLSDEEELRLFQQWKQEQKEWEDFEVWKKNSRGHQRNTENSRTGNVGENTNAGWNRNPRPNDPSVVRNLCQPAGGLNFRGRRFF